MNNKHRCVKCGIIPILPKNICRDCNNLSGYKDTLSTNNIAKREKNWREQDIKREIKRNGEHKDKWTQQDIKREIKRNIEREKITTKNDELRSRIEATLRRQSEYEKNLLVERIYRKIRNRLGDDPEYY